MSSYKDEIITYQVTLKGFWEDPEKRLWKSGRDIYHIDMNNNAKLLDQTQQLTSHVIFTQTNEIQNSSENDIEGENDIENDIEGELDALFGNSSKNEESKRGYYDLDNQETIRLNKKPKTI